MAEVTLHIITWLWQGWRPVYDRRDVAYIARQLLAHGDLPSGARILCLTDRPVDWYKAQTDALGVLEYPLGPDLPGLDMGCHPQYPWLPAFRARPNCFRRLRIFGADMQASLGIAPGDIVMSMDLDSIVGGSLQTLLAPMYNRVDPVDFMAMEGRVSVIHGSLFAFRAGTHRYVWDTFDPYTSPARLRVPPPGQPKYIGSDQAWLSTVIQSPRLWGEADGVYSWPRHHTTLRPGTKVTYMSFAGSSKPRGQECITHTPWLYEHAMRHWEN